MDYAMRERFKRMLIEERNTPTGMAVMMSMIGMVENDDRFEHLAELYEGIQEYGNFASEKEAKKVVDGLVSFDGSRGQKWSMDTIAEELKKAGGMLEERGHYNRWMLYILMNDVYADYGGVLQKLGVSPQDMPKAVYMMALARVNDRDRKKTLREHYGLE